jgi:hypothetical protein
MLDEKRAIVLSADQRPAVAGQRDKRQRPEDGVDCAARVALERPVEV